MTDNSILINYEKQIIHYLMKDPSYIEEIFFDRDISLDFFSDNDIRNAANICLKYYKKHKSVLVEEEILNIIDSEIKEGNLEKHESSNIATIFNEAIYSFTLEKEQFNRVFYEWLNAEVTPIAKKKIEECLPSLNAYKGLEGVSDLIKKLESIYILNVNATGIETINIAEEVEKQIEDIDKRRKNPQCYMGISTGIKALDEIFYGFENGTLNLIGGVTGTGKSTFILNVSKNIYEMSGKNVLIISLEMPISQWARKYNSLDFAVNYSSLLRGDKTLLSDDSWDKVKNKLLLRKSKKQLGSYNVISFPSGVYSWTYITKEIEKRYPNYKPDIIFVDQLSLINLSVFGKNTLKRDALGLLTKQIRSYAQLKRIPIVCAVQANRASIEKKKNGQRVINIEIDNIEDSNQIGADADSFIAVAPISDDLLLVKTAKQREGPKTSIKLKQKLDVCRIYDENQDLEFSNDSMEKIEDLTYDSSTGFLNEEIDNLMTSNPKEEKTDDSINLLIESINEDEYVLGEVQTEVINKDDKFFDDVNVGQIICEIKSVDEYLS